MKVAFIRGQYLNNFELQSYYPIKDLDPSIQLTGFSSLRPKHQTQLSTQKLPSPVDLPNFPYKLPILNRLTKDAMYLLGLENQLKGYDIAHVRETYFHFSAQAIRAKQKGFVKKVLVTCSETIPHNHETIWGRKKLKQLVLSHADHFHCLTQKAKQVLIVEGVPAQKITIIPYGIDLSKFQKPEKKQNRPTPKVRLLFVGRIEQQKGIYELVNAWKYIKNEYPETELKIIGKGPLEWYLKENNLTAQTYPYYKMPQIFHNADILVHPPKRDRYWEEYYGMVLIEAMAAGLAIVATDCGAIPEVVGNAAQIVRQGSGAQLYEGIKHLLKHPKWRKSLAQKAQKRANLCYDANRQAAKLARLYHKVLAQS